MLSAPFEVGFDIGAQSASFARYRRIPYRAELDLRAPDGRGQRGGSAAEVRSPDFLDASYHFASRLRVKPAGTFRASLREADRLAPASADPAPRGRFQAELELHASVRSFSEIPA